MEPNRFLASRPVSSATSEEVTILKTDARAERGPILSRTVVSGPFYALKVPRVTRCDYPVIYRVANGVRTTEPFASPRIPLRNGGPEC